MSEEFHNKTEAECILSYRAEKGHRTRSYRKIEKTINLQNAKYSLLAEKTILDEIKKMEAHQDKVTFIADYLRMGGINKSEQYVAEAAQLLTTSDALVDKAMKQIHDRAAAVNTQPTAQPQLMGPGTQGAKPIESLRPQKLQFEDNMAQFRRWKLRFKAYHDSSNLRMLTLTAQQAFLIACVDNDIADRITSTASETTEIFPNESEDNCYEILEQLFRERIPLLLRRQQFLSYKQSEGQNGLKFREELRNLADEADIAEMMPEDMLCVMYVRGVRSNELRERLLEVQEPSLARFNRIVDSFDQAKSQMAEIRRHQPATASASYKQQSQRQGRPTKPSSNNIRLPPNNQEESNRKKWLNGKCFRCGSAKHSLPKCPVPVTATCPLCNYNGHTKYACHKARTNNAQVEEITEGVEHLAIEYQPAGSVSAVSMMTSAANQPTPNVTL